MLTEQEALARILTSIQPLPAQRLPLMEAHQRFSARTLPASVPLPGFDNSAMDGYAVRAVDTCSPASLRVVAEQPAGASRQLTLEPHTAIRIFTGAPMPEGADAVIMQEDVTTDATQQSIVCREPVEHGENVRLAGCDLCVGQSILQTGDRLTSARLGLLATQGLAEVETVRLPRVAIITTGDELVPPGQPLLAGQLYNSNGIMLQALLKALGIEDITVQHVADDLTQTMEAMRHATGNHEVVILSGGVSVGDHDYVKPALLGLGIKPDFWRVKIKPGKPLLFVPVPHDSSSACYLFGLPGNPVSAYVTYLLFVRPALLKLMGAGDSYLFLPQVRGTLTQPQQNKGDRPHYIRGHYQDGKFTPQGLQQSHAIFNLAKANALMRLEPFAELKAGDEVSVLLAE
jgi:molybdopterin molybdotransferase